MSVRILHILMSGRGMEVANRTKVNHITDRNGTRMNFNRVVYRPQEGLPIANSMVVNTTNEVNCCGVCQETVSNYYIYTTPPSPRCLSSANNNKLA
jgi:hypothetical protein